MNELATAFTTMRKFGFRSETFSQQLDLSQYVNSDPLMPRKRLRRYLGQYGLRGEALNAEVRRIAAGPQTASPLPETWAYRTWPYGWQPADFTPMMRRIFKGKSTRHVMMLDELPLIFKEDF